MWDPNADGMTRTNNLAFQFKKKFKLDGQSEGMMMALKYECFVEGEVLVVIERWRIMDEKDFKVVRVWVHEEKGGRFIVFYSPPKKLMEFMGEQELMKECLTTISAFKTHLGITQNSNK